MAQPFARRSNAPKPETTKYEEQSPVLLVDQDAVTPKGFPDPSTDWTAFNQHLETRLNALRNWRTTWWTYWGALAQYLLPRRYRWLITPNNYVRGSPINQTIVDGAGTRAMYRAAAGSWSALTNPSRPWFELTADLPDEEELDADGEAWLESTQTTVDGVLGRSNYYTVMAQAFQDVMVFGTAPVIIYEDRDTVIRCYVPCAGEYFLDVGATLTVDTLYREESRTVLQIVERFGITNCPEVIQKAYRMGGASLQQEFVVAHAIEPNFPIAKPKSATEQIRPLPAGFQWREVYWLRGQRTDRELSRAGFKERPFVALRWATTSNDAYGRSPGMDVLGDVMQLQVITRRLAEFLEKGIRPPMRAPVELKNEPASINPGMITYMTEAGEFKPLFDVNPAWVGPINQNIEQLHQAIKDGFFEDIFMAISAREGVQPLNELELTQRDLERLQVLGPFIELFETEVGDPTIIRVLSILQRKGLLKPMPPSLRGKQLKIKYTSILSIAQQRARAAEVGDILAMGAKASEAAMQAQEPNPLRILDLDELMRDYAKNSSTNAKLVRTVAEVKQMDAMKAKNAQQQQAMQATLASVSAAKDLGSASIAPDTALGALAGQQPQGKA